MQTVNENHPFVQWLYNPKSPFFREFMPCDYVSYGQWEWNNHRVLDDANKKNPTYSPVPEILNLCDITSCIFKRFFFMLFSIFFGGLLTPMIICGVSGWISLLFGANFIALMETAVFGTGMMIIALVLFFVFFVWAFHKIYDHLNTARYAKLSNAYNKVHGEQTEAILEGFWANFVDKVCPIFKVSR